jgi:hypothetical protein
MPETVLDRHNLLAVLHLRLQYSADKSCQDQGVGSFQPEFHAPTGQKSYTHTEIVRVVGTENDLAGHPQPDPETRVPQDGVLGVKGRKRTLSPIHNIIGAIMLIMLRK